MSGNQFTLRFVVRGSRPLKSSRYDDTLRLVSALNRNKYSTCVCFWLLIILVNMSYLLKKLSSKKEVDDVIKSTEDLVLVLRFGRDSDITCMQLDEIVSCVVVLSCLDK